MLLICSAHLPVLYSLFVFRLTIDRLRSRLSTILACYRSTSWQFSSPSFCLPRLSKLDIAQYFWRLSSRSASLSSLISAFVKQTHFQPSLKTSSYLTMPCDGFPRNDTLNAQVSVDNMVSPSTKSTQLPHCRFEYPIWASWANAGHPKPENNGQNWTRGRKSETSHKTSSRSRSSSITTLCSLI